MTKRSDTLDKEQKQLALCRQLITGNAFRSQEALRRALKQHGYRHISQSTVSRLLGLLGVTKARNAKGERTYILTAPAQAEPHAACPLAEMVLGIEANQEFILIQTVTGYGRAVGRLIDHHALPGVLGVVAGSSTVWVAPRSRDTLTQTRQQLSRLLMAG